MEAQPKTRVLIVDDDQTLCDMYAERLKAEGFEVVVAHNGEEGVAKATQYMPNVILLDLMMPKVNGFNTLEILKSTEETKNIPVLLLTALIQEENKRRGLQAGAEDYIIKSETMPGDVIVKIKAGVEKGKQAQARAAGGNSNVQQSSVGTPTPATQPGPSTPTTEPTPPQPEEPVESVPSAPAPVEPPVEPPASTPAPEVPMPATPESPTQQQPSVSAVPSSPMPPSFTPPPSQANEPPTPPQTQI